MELSGRYEIIRKERWVDREESLERERGEEGRSMKEVEGLWVF